MAIRTEEKKELVVVSSRRVVSCDRCREEMELQSGVVNSDGWRMISGAGDDAWEGALHFCPECYPLAFAAVKALADSHAQAREADATLEAYHAS